MLRGGCAPVEVAELSGRLQETAEAIGVELHRQCQREARALRAREVEFPVPFLFETPYTNICLVPPEGRIAIVTDAEWDAMDAAVSRVAMTWQGRLIEPVSR